MKRLIPFIAALLILCGSAYAETQKVTGIDQPQQAMGMPWFTGTQTVGKVSGQTASTASECGTYELLCENFENVGTPTGWLGLVNSYDFVNTTAPLRGSKSLKLICGNSCSVLGSVQAPSFTAQNTVYGHFMVQFNGSTVYGSPDIVAVYNSTTLLAHAWLNYDNTIGIRHGLGTPAYTPAINFGTTYHFYWKYSKGTGSNGILQIWLGTSKDRASATLTASCPDGTATAQADNIRHTYGGGDATCFTYIDQDYISATEFTTVP